MFVINQPFINMDLIILLNAIRMVNLNTQLTVTNINLTIYFHKHYV